MRQSKIIQSIFVLTFFVFSVGSCLAEELGRVDDRDFSVTVDSKSSGHYVVEISNKGNNFKINKTWTPEVFVLTKPTRLVIDIPGLKANKSTISPIDRKPILAIRTGVHQDKVRVVLDLTDDRDYKLESYAIERVGKGFVVVGVDFKETGKKDHKFRLPFGLWESGGTTTTSTSTTQKPTTTTHKQTLTISASSTTTTSSSSTTSTTLKPTTTTTSSTTSTTLTTQPKIIKSLDDVEIKPVTEGKVISEPSDVIEDKEEVKDIPTDLKTSETVVTSVNFESLDNNEELMLSVGVDNLADYSLDKRKSTIYELVIRNSTISGPQLTLPQFPPQTVRGIEGAILRTSDDDVILKIYVEDGVTLSPFRKNGKVWIKVN